MVGETNAELVVDAKATVGEAPAWDARSGRLVWADIPAGVVYGTSQDASGWTIETIGSLAEPVGAAVPRASGGYALATGTRFAALDDSGVVETIAELPGDVLGMRLNDGKCDPAGRFWAGTQPLAGEGVSRLYRLDSDGSVHTMLEGVQISNGLGWSPDGTRFYYIDTPTCGVDVFDFDVTEGSIRNRRRLIEFGPGAGRPDGMCVDDDGHLWVAVPMSGTVRRYAPDGTQVATVRVSAPVVTSCAFGGADLDTLFITSGTLRLPVDQLQRAGIPLEMVEKAASAPGAGGLFTVRPGVRGPAAVPYAG
jgi:sugar lactone lactonase YvrE